MRPVDLEAGAAPGARVFYGRTPGGCRAGGRPRGAGGAGGRLVMAHSRHRARAGRLRVQQWGGDGAGGCSTVEHPSIRRMEAVRRRGRTGWRERAQARRAVQPGRPPSLREQVSGRQVLPGGPQKSADPLSCPRRRAATRTVISLPRHGNVSSTACPTARQSHGCSGRRHRLVPEEVAGGQGAALQRARQSGLRTTAGQQARAHAQRGGL